MLQTRVRELFPGPTAPTVEPIGLLLGRPGSSGALGRPSWVLYESGDIVLRRSPKEEDVIAATCHHLVSLQHAVTSSLLPLRLRGVLLADGGAVLAEAAPLHDLAGHDRRLATRGCLVLPTTVCVVDPVSMELVLPEGGVEQHVPSGRVAIRTIVLREPGSPDLAGAAKHLAVARNVLRHGDQDLQSTLEQIDLLVRGAGPIELAAHNDVSDVVDSRCGPG